MSEQKADGSHSFDSSFYKDLLEHMSDGVYFVDNDRRIQFWNQGAVRLTGYTSEEIVGRHCQEDILCHVDQAGRKLCLEGCPLVASISDGDHHQANVFLRHKAGRRLPVNVRVQPIRDKDGTIQGAVEIFSDDSAQAEAQRKNEALNRLAFLDHLTELPNRRFLDMTLHTAMQEFQTHHDPFGVLLFDVDHFKEINDRSGHAFGDRALKEIAKTLAGALRSTDVIGRWGGDEFLAIVGHVDGKTIRELAERSVMLVKETRVEDAEGKAMPLSISVGAVLAANTLLTAEELLRQADQLMYISKRDGRGCATIG